MTKGGSGKVLATDKAPERRRSPQLRVTEGGGEGAGKGGRESEGATRPAAARGSTYRPGPLSSLSRSGIGRGGRGSGQ